MHTSTVWAGLIAAAAALKIPATPVLPQPDRAEKGPANPEGTSFRVYQKRVPSTRRHVRRGLDFGGLHAGPLSKRQMADNTTQGFSAAALPARVGWEYSTPFTVGGQTFNLNLDTGSSDFWLFSENMNRDDFQDPNNVDITHGLYRTAKSTTQKAWGDHFFGICYSDSTCASGTVVNETIGFGGASVTGLPIGLASAVSNALTSDIHVDGVAGLAFNTQNSVYEMLNVQSQALGVDVLNQSQPQQTFLEALMPTLKDKVFTAALSYGNDGAYEFGAINPQLYSGTIHYTPVNSIYSLWQFEVGKTFKIGDKSFTASCSTTQAIADTGASLVKMANEVVEAYYAQIPSASVLLDGKYAGGYVYACNESASTPALHIPIGTNGGKDYSISIPKGLMTYDVYNQAKTLCYGKLQKFSGDGQDNPDFHVMGVAILKQHFVVFDQDNMQIGFADRKTTGAPQPTMGSLPGGN